MRSWLVVLSVLAPCLAWGDAVILNDGTRLEGELKREGMGWAVTDASGQTTSVGDDQVKMVEKAGNLTPEQLASFDLASLRRWMAEVTDTRVAIEHYQKFIDQNKGKPVVADAEKDLRLWQDRQANGMTRLGDKWLTPRERQEVMRQIASIIDDVKSKVDAGRLKDAEESLKQVFALDPAQPSGSYLQGVIDYRQKQYAVARKAFDRAREKLKDHGQTLANLAISEFQARSYAAALDHFDQAMQALPKNRQLLDDVAQALHDLPDADRNSPLALRVARRFQQQDAELQKQLKDAHLARWGATYIPDDQMAEVKKAQSQNKDKVDAITQELNKDQARLAQIDRQMDVNKRNMDRMEYERRLANARGRGNRALPGAYYNDKRENDKLKDERADLAKKSQNLQRQLNSAQQQNVPYPPYPGPLKLFGPEGMPSLDLTASSRASAR